MQTETSSIDPHFALVGANQVVAQHIFDPLLAADANLRPVPGLASVTDPEPDIWEFRIRPDACFHDGTPVTAEDVRFSLERMRRGYAHAPPPRREIPPPDIPALKFRAGIPRHRHSAS